MATATRASELGLAGPEGKDERAARTDLASMFRMLHHLGMSYLIYSHISARVPGCSDEFYINCYGETFDEVTASGLMRVNLDGEVISGSGIFNRAGVAIHRAVYRARTDVSCVIHTHTVAGSGVAALPAGLLPISQDALEIYDEVGYHPYGVTGHREEAEALGKSCKSGNCIILRNHGLLTMGASMQLAFWRLFMLERACQIQMSVGGSRSEPEPIPEETRRGFAVKMKARHDSGMLGHYEWDSMQRLLGRLGSDHAR